MNATEQAALQQAAAQFGRADRIDVLAYHDALIACHKALSADAYHAQELPKAEAVRAAVAELMEDVQRIRQRAARAEADGTLMRGALANIVEACDDALARVGGAA